MVDADQRRRAGRCSSWRAAPISRSRKRHGGLGLGIHEMGTAHMGKDPAKSVLNQYNQAHDVPNLFVTDGACMASGGCQNPSLTYMAMSARGAHYAAEFLKEGRNLSEGHRRDRRAEAMAAAGDESIGRYRQSS